jgi:hypothetical protein
MSKKAKAVPEPLFVRTQMVRKFAGDYKFVGTVIAVFQKLGGQWRYVVENGDGVLHIFSAEQLESLE